MPFLVPALMALASDGCILYLNRLGKQQQQRQEQQQQQQQNHEPESMSNSNYHSMMNELAGMVLPSQDETETEKVYFWTGYLAPLAGVRIMLLLLPLLFHSYTGTALRFPRLYRILYISTLLMVSLHMLGLLFINPQSLESILPWEEITGSNHSSNSNSSNAEPTASDGNNEHDILVRQRRFLLQHVHALRRVWWMLLFSMWSNICHLILLHHVRSTAPVNAHWLQKKYKNKNQRNSSYKQPQSVYFAIRSTSRSNFANDIATTAATPRRHAATATATGGEEPDYQDEDDDEPALVNAVNDFLVDVQIRMQRTRLEWAQRLDDFTRKMQDRTSNNGTATGGGGGGGAAAAASASSSSSSLTHGGGGASHSNTTATATTTTTSPFSVLLQLFADQDVLYNGRLSAAFDSDGGQSMTILVPQLLSYLLHGATTTSQDLEEWILQKCSQHVQFAHRCYWFLRAWCLEVPGDVVQPLSQAVLSRQNSDSQLLAFNDLTNTNTLLGGAAAGGGSLIPSSLAILAQPAPYLDQPAMSQSQSSEESITYYYTDHDNSGGITTAAAAATTSMAAAAANLCRPTSAADQHHHSVSSLVASGPLGGGAPAPTPALDDKFLPQERAMIERLMLRVKECGEQAARVLEYGRNNIYYNNNNNHHHNQVPPMMPTLAMSPSQLMQVVENGSVPIDPLSGRPSQRHVDVLAAPYKYGFLPLPIHVNNSAGARRSKYQKAEETISMAAGNADLTEQFDKTPQFLDALLWIAQYLHTVPRDRRKEELQVMLRQLECDLLPDNCVYIPSRRNMGRVWRIAVSECIPISTKERVPCILALEMVRWTDDTLGKLDPQQQQHPHPHRSRNSGNNHTKNESHEQDPEHETAEQQQQQPPWRSLLDLPMRLSTGVLSGGSNRNHGITDSSFLSPDVVLNTAVSLRRMVSDERPQQDYDERGDSAVLLNHSSLSAAGGYPQRSAEPISEARMVQEWTKKPRNPMRLVPLINKVAESMKGTMDRVRVSVHERLLELRTSEGSTQRGSSFDEMKSLTACTAGDGTDRTTPQEEDDEDMTAFSSVSSLAVAAAAAAAAAVDNNSKNKKRDIESGLFIPSMIPLAPSLDVLDPKPPPMGQWSSPVVTPTKARSIRCSPTATATTTTTTTTNSSSPVYKLRRRNEGSIPKAAPKPGPYGTQDYHNQSTLPAATTDKTQVPQQQQQQRRKGDDYKDDRSAASTVARTPPVVFRESWQLKQERIRKQSAYGSHPGWQLVPILIKGNDDLRQEELASQLIYRMASILAREKVPVWLYPHEIIALTNRGGMMEAIPDTISIDSLKKNDPNFTNLRDFFHHHFGETESELQNAKANFVESLAAYSMVCFLLQIKDRHNGNILIDSVGHVIHIDFGFFFLSSPGKNAGFESAPFKLTRDFMEVMDGPHSHLFHVYRELCVRSFLALRKHCLEILLLVEMLQMGNERLGCFLGRPAEAIEGLRSRFRVDLNDRACREYVHSLIDDSMENWRTDWYDRYQRYFVGVL